MKVGTPVGPRLLSLIAALMVGAGVVAVGCQRSQVDAPQDVTSGPLPVTGLQPAKRIPSPQLPCGTERVPAATHHVLWIWLENKQTSQVLGSPTMPYFNQLAQVCGVAPNDHAISHPSLPNYVGATSGLSLPSLHQFFGDCGPAGSCVTPAASIFSLVPS